MAETMWDVLNKVRGKNGPKNQPVNVVILQPPSQAMRQARQQVYTGAGPDGIVQPDKPVAMIPGYRGMNVMHEGENASIDGNQVQVTPASQVRQPAVNTLPQPTAVQQQNMQRTQNAPGNQGFAGGGAFGIPNLGNYIQDSINKAGQAVQQKAQGGTPTQTPAKVNTLGVPDIGQGMNNAFGGAYDAIKSKLDQSGFTAAYNEANRPASTVNVGPGRTYGGRRSDNYGSVGTETNTSLQPQNAETPAATTPPAAVNTIPNPPAQSAYQQGAEEGYSKIRDVARGQSEVNDLARDRALNYFDANAASNDAATIQRLRSEGWSDNDIQAYMLQQSRSTGVQRGGIVTDLAIDEKTRAEGAARDLTTLGRSAYESDRSFDYNRDVQAAKTALEAGDFASASKLLQQAFPGSNIDLARLQQNQQLDDFFTGLENLNTMAATPGFDINKVDPAMLGVVAQGMGTSVEGLKGMYSGLKTNPLDIELDKFFGSKYYQSLTDPKEKAAFEQMIKTMVVGDIDGWSQDDKGVWHYTPTATAVGSTVTKTQTSKSGSTTVTNDDGTVTVTPPTQGIGSKPGDYFVSGDGNIYVNKGEGRDPEPIPMSFEMINAADFDPFGEDALKVAALTDEDNPYLSAIVTRQAEAIRNKEMTADQMLQIARSGAARPGTALDKVIVPEQEYTFEELSAAHDRTFSGGGNDYWEKEGFGEGNKVITVDGEKFYLSPRQTNGTRGVDGSKYTLTSLSDPNRVIYWSAGEGRHGNSASVSFPALTEGKTVTTSRTRPV